MEGWSMKGKGTRRLTSASQQFRHSSATLLFFTTTTYELADPTSRVSSVKYHLTTLKPANDPALLNSSLVNPANTHDGFCSERNVWFPWKLATSRSPLEGRKERKTLLKNDTPKGLPSAP